MQVSGLQRRYPAPTFVNHTPRLEITVQDPSHLSSDMFGPDAMAIGAGPLYTNAIMGQVPSAVERENYRKASSTILREDFIEVEESENISRPDSWSMHYDCTNQAPYSTQKDNKMMTQASLLHIPKENPSHDLAFFLRTTGPTAPHRRPSKIDHARRSGPGAKNALRFLKFKHKRQARSIVEAHERLNCMLRDEGGLLADLPVKQKVSSTGKRYLALQVPSSKEHKIMADRAATKSPDVVGSDGTDENWYYASSKRGRSKTAPSSTAKSFFQRPYLCESTVRPIDSSSPLRPPHSTPPTPGPEFVGSIHNPYRNCLAEHPAKRAFEVAGALSSHPVHAGTSASLPLPDVSQTQVETPVKHPSPGREVDIKHPSPRRFASHPVLLQRASSIASSLYPRSVSDSPGPPPRSPLRLRRDPRTIEGLVATPNERNTTPKLAPSIKGVNEYNAGMQPIKPTMVTDCTGPIKRPRSSGKNSIAHPAYPTSRKEREERTRTRKARDRSGATQPIDAVVNAPSPPQRQRLKKPRPHIQIPDLRPAPLATRASSSASSNASGKKVTEYTRTPVSAVPSEDASSHVEILGDAMTSPNQMKNFESIAFSPVMLVAEEVPLQTTKSPSRTVKPIVKDGKQYAPRPRSASIPRSSAMKRRSRSGIKTPTRPDRLNDEARNDDTPPLPSPPPTRALPPTPPASESEKTNMCRAALEAETRKILPAPPEDELMPIMPAPLRRNHHLPHVATQAQRRRVPMKDTAVINDRLEALEKQNSLLEAALTAVLRTNGNLNSPLSTDFESSRGPMNWENRIARRSAASHAASSSNGSALEMYLNTINPSQRVR